MKATDQPQAPEGGSLRRRVRWALCSIGWHSWDRYGRMNGHHMCLYCSSWRESPNVNLRHTENQNTNNDTN